MRRMSLILAVLLAACQMTLPGGGARSPEVSNPITGAAIEVSSLDAPRPAPKADAVATTQPAATQPAATQPAPTQPARAPLPGPETAAAAETAPPPVRKSPEQIACEKTRGSWSAAGKTGTMLCVRPTRDSGKSCRKGTECEGLCLARSGTCAPIAPMFGCNDILQDNGQRVTLCID